MRGLVLHSGRVLPGVAARAAPDAALSALERLVLHGMDDEVIPLASGR